MLSTFLGLEVRGYTKMFNRAASEMVSRLLAVQFRPVLSLNKQISQAEPARKLKDCRTVAPAQSQISLSSLL